MNATIEDYKSEILDYGECLAKVERFIQMPGILRLVFSHTTYTTIVIQECQESGSEIVELVFRLGFRGRINP